jgi:hypothetical protein
MEVIILKQRSFPRKIGRNQEWKISLGMGKGIAILVI